MSHEVEATYEDGVLKLHHPLPLRNQEQVIVTVRPKIGRMRALAGILPWRGDDSVVVRQIAEDPDLDYPERL